MLVVVGLVVVSIAVVLLLVFVLMLVIVGGGVLGAVASVVGLRSRAYSEPRLSLRALTCPPRFLLRQHCLRAVEKKAAANGRLSDTARNCVISPLTLDLPTSLVAVLSYAINVSLLRTGNYETKRQT